MNYQVTCARLFMEFPGILRRGADQGEGGGGGRVDQESLRVIDQQQSNSWRNNSATVGAIKTIDSTLKYCFI